MENLFLKLPEEYREYLQKYLELVKTSFGKDLVSVCVFGSVARGRAKPTSDIDILLIADNLPETLNKRMTKLHEIHLTLKKTESYKCLKNKQRNGSITEFVFSRDEIKNHPPILLDIIDDGIILYDRESFLRSVLDDIRKRLKELGSKKIVINEDKWFWVLKPDIKFGERVKI